MADSQITKRVLAQSIKELMANSPLSKISVGDITEHCGINRQTFYYHFKDKYDLVNWIYYTETMEYMSSFSDKEHWSDGLCNLCLYMQKNKKFYMNALNTPGQNSFSEYLTQFLRELILLLFSDLEQNKTISQEDLDIIADFYTFALVGIIMKWAKNGMIEPPNYYIDRIKTLTSNNLLNNLNEN